MMLEEGIAMREDAGRGWRRVVPSPEPKEIVEIESIRDLVKSGVITICSGGGGVPVVRSRGALRGIAAVIDKDLAAALLARELDADALVILTDVPKVYVNYNTPEQRALDRVTASEMRALAAEGHFKAGSMGPKVEACLRFVEHGGQAVIASLTEVVPALEGDAGTHIVPDAASGRRRQTTARKRDGAAPRGRTSGTTRTRTKRGEAQSAGADVIDMAAARRRAAAD